MYCCRDLSCPYLKRLGLILNKSSSNNTSFYKFKISYLENDVLSQNDLSKGRFKPIKVETSWMVTTVLLVMIIIYNFEILLTYPILFEKGSQLNMM